MPTIGTPEPSVDALLRGYLNAVTLAEPLQSELWAAAQLTLTQVRALRRIAAEPRSLGQLGAELGLPAPSVTRVIDRLEERGFVERRREDPDRRKVVAVALPAGRRVVSSLGLGRKSPMRLAAERLDPATRARLAAAFEEFVAAVLAAAPATP